MIRGIFTSVVLTAALMALAACSPPPQDQPSENRVPGEAPAEIQDETAQQPDAPQGEGEVQPAQPATAAQGDVEALIAEKVEGQHDLERIYTATKTREEWEETLDRMIAYGAEINAEEKQLIIDYLLSRQD